MLKKHAIEMLETLQQYQNSDISITLHNPEKEPAILIRYQDDAYVITHLETMNTELYTEMEEALQAIEAAAAKIPASV